MLFIIVGGFPRGVFLVILEFCWFHSVGVEMSLIYLLQCFANYVCIISIVPEAPSLSASVFRLISNICRRSWFSDVHRLLDALFVFVRLFTLETIWRNVVRSFLMFH